MACQLPENGNNSQRQKQADNECQTVRADHEWLGEMDWGKSHLSKIIEKLGNYVKYNPAAQNAPSDKFAWQNLDDIINFS
jgi:hypothetical protein